METSIEWHDAREVLLLENEVVIVQGLEGACFVCREPYFEHMKEQAKFFWVDEPTEDYWHPVTQFPFWCHWPTVNDEGCVG